MQEKEINNNGNKPVKKKPALRIIIGIILLAATAAFLSTVITLAVLFA